MADVVISVGPKGQYKKKLYDNQDGSYSDSVYVKNIAGGTITSLAVMGSDGAVERTLSTDTAGRLFILDSKTSKNGFSTETAAQTDKALIPAVVGKEIYVQRLIVTNDDTAAITVKLITDTTDVKTAVTPILNFAKSCVEILDFGELGIPGTSGKNIGFTSTGTSNYTVQVVGYVVS